MSILSRNEAEFLEGLILMAEGNALQEIELHRRKGRPQLLDVVTRELEMIRSIRRRLAVVGLGLPRHSSPKEVATLSKAATGNPTDAPGVAYSPGGGRLTVSGEQK